MGPFHSIERERVELSPSDVGRGGGDRRGFSFSSLYLVWVEKVEG